MAKSVLDGLRTLSVEELMRGPLDRVDAEAIHDVLRAAPALLAALEDMVALVDRGQASATLDKARSALLLAREGRGAQ